MLFRSRLLGHFVVPSRPEPWGERGGLWGERRGHCGQPGGHGLGMGGREGDTATPGGPQEDGVPPPSASARRWGCPIPAPPQGGCWHRDLRCPHGSLRSPTAPGAPRSASAARGVPAARCPPAPHIPSAGRGNPRGPLCAARPRKDPAAPRPLLSAHNKGILHSALPSQQRDAPLPPHPASIN